MHQTVYIDVDEEITSILDRVRQESTMDIFLVVPKGAMLLNSIINLKLLKKESDKMGKVISIVAPNDKRAKIMIERAGIKAEDYNQTMNEQQLQEAAIKPVQTEQINKAVTDAVGETSQQIMQGGFDVGSNSFFSGGKQAQVNSLDSSQSQGQPEAQASIGEESFSQNRSVQRIQSPQTTQVAQVAQVVQQNVGYQGSTREVLQPINNIDYAQAKNNHQEQLGKPNNNGYSQEDKQLDYFNKQESSNFQNNKSSKNSSFKHKFLIGIVALVSVILLGGGGWYLTNYPKLTLFIKPLSKSVDKEIKIIAKEEVSDVDIDDKIIPGEYIEISFKKEMNFSTTGEKVVDKNGAKARGVVTIENSFSDKPQRLVKTTRIISKDGKLFRLTKDATVPGMKDDKPGKIEATVEADKPGKEFNITKGAFVIAAWKGSPKGEKFKVSSIDAMTGGVTSADSKTQKVVSKTDLDSARKETLKALDDSLEEEVRKRLNPGQNIVLSSIEKEIISSKASHLVDTIADKFMYTVVYKIKIMTFKDSDIKKVISSAIQTEIGKDYELEPDFKLETKRGVVDLDKKTITIYVDVEGISRFKIDEVKLKEDIAGQNSENTKKALSRDAGIQSAEIKPSPSWSSKSPGNTDKITIEIVK
jgi:hypothetical protein